jgi:FkbM family methyltransferase
MMIIKLTTSVLRPTFSLLKNILRRCRDFLTWDPWVNRSWSQEGEDMVLRRVFEKKTGFYVDVGAHHPKRFSNTYFFYRMGWSGINIDAMPGSMKEFDKYRRRDINLELGVAKQEGILNYYAFNEPALNTFSVSLAERRKSSENNYYIKKIIKIKVKPLHEIFACHLNGKKIDLLNVDVEGFDLNVLESNDWSKYRPRFVLAEILEDSLHNIQQDKVVQFMREQDYEVYAKLMNMVFFKDLQVNH